MRPSRLVIALLALEMATTIGAADSRTGAFAVAVVRRDGAIVPFAVFDGKRWSSTWPAPKHDLEIPISITSVPKGWWGPTGLVAEWQMWPAAGDGTPTTIHVTQPDWIDAHCVRQVALKTDYKSALPAPPPAVQPYPKDGLAISPARALERIEAISGGTEGASALAEGLRAKFNEAELDTASRFNHPVARRDRERIDPEVEALYAFGENPRAYYIEASRPYRTREDKGCVIGFGTGWFARDREKTTWLDMAVDLLPCDKYGATYMLPFGALRIDGRTFWIVQFSGWDHERYVVAELKKDKVEALVSAWGGGC